MEMPADIARRGELAAEFLRNDRRLNAADADARFRCRRCDGAQHVGQAAAVIRGKRPPEPYHAKGIRYQGETIRRKAGKAGKSK